MRDPDESPRVRIDRRWFRFGVVIGVLHLAFLAVLLVLLRVDVVLALAFAIVASVTSGIAVILYVRRRM